MGYSFPNPFTDTIEILPYVTVAESYNLNAEIVQISCPFFIIFPSIVFKMLAAINFYNQFGSSAVEICNIYPYRFLTMKTGLAHFQKIIPKVPFLPGHIVAELSGFIFQIFTISEFFHLSLAFPAMYCVGGEFEICPQKIAQHIVEGSKGQARCAGCQFRVMLHQQVTAGFVREFAGGNFC